MATGLVDTFGRTHTNLRISVTDRCNIRCYYCMPEEPTQFGRRDEILSFEEMARVARVAVSLGVDKIRVTGGEPLLRRDLTVLLRSLSTMPGVRELSLTTNGVLLAREAAALADAGLTRINVHLDTLDRERFRFITRRDDFDKVMAGIDEAQRAGMRVKINAVALKGVTEADLVPLARFGRERGIEVRFIEFMPLDAQGIWDIGKVLTADEMIARIQSEIGALEAVPDADPRAPATEYRYADGVGRLGFIASVSRPFCMNCNRLRLTADGKLRYCLFAVEETDVKGLLRGGATDEQIAERLRANVHAKWVGHEIQQKGFVPPPRPMYSIGG
jgi:cyclic pyranopterin phosphate synthase